METAYILIIAMIIGMMKLGTGILAAQDSSVYRYRGAETCAAVCHNNEGPGFQYEIWKKSAHSKSYDALASAKAKKYAIRAGINNDPREELKCLRCHITAAGLDSLYYLPTYRKEDGVTCEACHKIKSMNKTIILEDEDCLNCHNRSVHKTGKFVFEKKFSRIAHPMPD